MPEISQADYLPLQVSLHWLIVLLVFAAFVLGKFMSGQPNEADKIPLIGFHMALGLATLIAMMVRIVARLRLPKPSPVSTGNSVLDNVAKLVHNALYLFVLLMTHPAWDHRAGPAVFILHAGRLLSPAFSQGSSPGSYVV